MKLINPSGYKKIILQAGEAKSLFLEDFEGGSRNFELDVDLSGEGAVCDIVGRVAVKGSDKKNWKIRQIFKGASQVGTMDLRGVAEENSFLGFDGAGVLASSALDVEVKVSEKIRLFDAAKGRSLPVLTVKTDQVKSASHAASIAPVSAEQLLYLESRGIDRELSQQILREGFLK